MKKIVFITGSLPPIKCGVGYYSHRLLEGLAGKGLELSVISTKGVTDDTGFPLDTTPAWKIRNISGLARLIRARQPEIIHIQYPAVGYGRQLGINILPFFLRIRLPKAKLVITLHEYSQSRWIGRARNFVTIAPAHEIIVSNQADRSALPAWLRKKIKIIPIGSNIERLPKNPKTYQAVMAKSKLDPEAPTLMFFGFAYPNKGLESLLRAMEDERLASYQLLLLCDLSESNPYQKSLVEKVKRINQKSKRAAWAGFLPDNEVSAILQEGRYFVLPQSSPLSAKSGTAIAAITHGLVLISAGAGQIDKTKPFEHRQNCYLTGKMSREALVTAIADLDSSPRLRADIHQGAEKLAGYFSWGNIAKLHLELYE